MRTLMNPQARPFRLLAATALLALAAGFGQTAMAQAMGERMGGPGHEHHGRHGGPGMGMMSPQLSGRALDSVGASAEQKAQIKQIMDAAHADLKAQREAGRHLHEQSRALFTQPNVDARAAETLRQQMLAQHDTASKRLLQAMLDASRVLTPEQRKALGERLAQRRTMMERHRAERESVAPTPAPTR